MLSNAQPLVFPAREWLAQRRRGAERAISSPLRLCVRLLWGCGRSPRCDIGMRSGGALIGAFFIVSLSVLHAGERQITHDAFNHELDNNDNFSPDDHFLVFD